jgi:hypothetical protein
LDEVATVHVKLQNVEQGHVDLVLFEIAEVDLVTREGEPGLESGCKLP